MMKSGWRMRCSVAAKGEGPLPPAALAALSLPGLEEQEAQAGEEPHGGLSGEKHPVMGRPSQK
jgi:hypothetical protein